jgi:hypothetical protein
MDGSAKQKYFCGLKNQICDFYFQKYHFSFRISDIKNISKVGVEESIVNAPLVSLQSKNTNNAKSEVSFKQLIRDLLTVVRSQSTLQRLL